MQMRPALYEHKALIYILPLLLLPPVAQARAAVRLPSIFSDNMVLQRGVRAPVWGTAAPGEQVTVRIAGHTVTAKACATRTLPTRGSRRGRGI